MSKGKKLFISGSISIESLPKEIDKSLYKAQDNEVTILIGDAPGVDKLIQERLKNNNQYFNVTIYSIYPNPRNIASKKFQAIKVDIPEGLRSERDKQKVKDKKMSEDCDYFLVIWNGKSRGSFNNIKKALEMNKPVKIYLQPQERFLKRNEITLENLEKIHRETSGYTLTELLKEINTINISSPKIKKEELWFKLEQLGIIDREKQPTKQYVNDIDIKFHTKYKSRDLAV